MKKLKSLGVLFFVLLLSHSSKSQDFGDIFRAGTADAQLYLQEYTKPIMLSFNNGLSSGWYNTAKPHKVLGFDLTATVNIANIPTSDRTFNFNGVNWNNLQLQPGSDNILPTAVGGPTTAGLRIPGNTTIDLGNGQTVTYNNNIDFDAPEGFDINDIPIAGFPVPAIQLGIGLPKNTELKVRYASDFGALGEDGNFTLFGIGVMHDLKQWIPGIKQLPFDVSGFMGYSRLNSEFDININEAEFDADGVAELKASSFTVQGVISKQLAIFTPYVGVGYNFAKSTFDVKGTFSYTDSFTNSVETVNDPVALEFSGASSARINAGLRIKLLILTLNAEYAIQKYNTFTLGVGFSVR